MSQEQTKPKPEPVDAPKELYETVTPAEREQIRNAFNNLLADAFKKAMEKSK